MKKLKYISVSPETARRIAKEEKVTVASILAALRFATNGERPERIREKALEAGGIETFKMI